jgi:hypothetical protein
MSEWRPIGLWGLLIARLTGARLETGFKVRGVQTVSCKINGYRHYRIMTNEESGGIASHNFS